MDLKERIMKILLIGYGRMGKEIEKIAIERNHDIINTIDIHNYSELNQENASKADVAIEFTTPDSVLKNIYRCFELDLPIVTGTTGWHKKLKDVSLRCKKDDQSLFYASNFSIGVNLFFALNEKMARLMENFEQYDVSIKEIHHTKKLDSPSGTAASLADIIRQNLSRKNDWTMEEPLPSDIHISAIREGDIKGIHSVKYESGIDFIELNHHAKSRKGFAKGAVLAAEYLLNKKGIFTMRDLLEI